MSKDNEKRTDSLDRKEKSLMKNNLVIIIVIIVSAIALMGGGLAVGILLTKNNNPTISKVQNTTQSQQPASSDPGTPAEKIVAKTGVCHSGEIKRLSAGKYTVGEDIASGEYIIKNDNKKDSPYVSLAIYPSKSSMISDEYNNVRVAIFDPSETRSLKIDTGNYMDVAYGGLLTCQ